MCFFLWSNPSLAVIQNGSITKTKIRGIKISTSHNRIPALLHTVWTGVLQKTNACKLLHISVESYITNLLGTPLQFNATQYNSPPISLITYRFLHCIREVLIQVNDHLEAAVNVGSMKEIPLPSYIKHTVWCSERSGEFVYIFLTLIHPMKRFGSHAPFTFYSCFCTQSISVTIILPFALSFMVRFRVSDILSSSCI